MCVPCSVLQQLVFFTYIMDKSCGWTDAIHYSGGSALQHRQKSKWAHYKWYRSGMCPEDHNSHQWRRNKWTLVWCEGNFSLNGDLMTNKIISDLAKMISDGFSLNSSSQLLAWQKRVLHKSWFYQDEIPTDEGRWETTVTVNTDKYSGPSAWKQHTSLRFPMLRREGSKRGDVSWTDTKLWHNYHYCWERTWIVKFHLGQAELCKLVSVFSSLKKQSHLFLPCWIYQHCASGCCHWTPVNKVKTREPQNHPAWKSTSTSSSPTINLTQTQLSDATEVWIPTASDTTPWLCPYFLKEQMAGHSQQLENHPAWLPDLLTSSRRGLSLAPWPSVRYSRNGTTRLTAWGLTHHHHSFVVLWNPVLLGLSWEVTANQNATAKLWFSQAMHRPRSTQRCTQPPKFHGHFSFMHPRTYPASLFFLLFCNITDLTVCIKSIKSLSQCFPRQCSIPNYITPDLTALK